MRSHGYGDYISTLSGAGFPISRTIFHSALLNICSYSGKELYLGGTITELIRLGSNI